MILPSCNCKNKLLCKQELDLISSLLQVKILFLYFTLLLLVYDSIVVHSFFCFSYFPLSIVDVISVYVFWYAF